jgi:hypothetical protein
MMKMKKMKMEKKKKEEKKERKKERKKKRKKERVLKKRRRKKKPISLRHGPGISKGWSTFTGMADGGGASNRCDGTSLSVLPGVEKRDKTSTKSKPEKKNERYKKPKPKPKPKTTNSKKQHNTTQKPAPTLVFQGEYALEALPLLPVHPLLAVVLVHAKLHRPIVRRGLLALKACHIAIDNLRAIVVAIVTIVVGSVASLGIRVHLIIVQAHATRLHPLTRTLHGLEVYALRQAQRNIINNINKKR